MKSKPLPTLSEDDIRHYTLYALSLPERLLRSGLGLLSGAVKQTGELLLPKAFRDSETYSTFITQSLDFLIAECGDLADPSETTKDQYIARKAVGNFIELASYRMLPISPALFLAIVADTAYGSKVYIEAVAKELKADGLIREDARVESTSDLLAAVNSAAADAAKALETPPLNAEEFQATVKSVRQSFAGVEGQAKLTRAQVDDLWNDFVTTAKATDQSLLTVSTVAAMNLKDAFMPMMATSTRATKAVFEESFLRETKENLAHIRQVGFYSAVRENCRPYTANVHRIFGAQKNTVTPFLMTSGVTGDRIDRFLGRKKSTK